MDEYASSHAVIKALKGMPDPPRPGGPSKIAIARRTWDSMDIYFPNKDEVLADWILSAFLKDKGNANESSSVLSHLYWSLLGDVLATGLQTQASRTNRVWLSPLLNRLSVATITTSFFDLVSSSNARCGKELVERFVPCMLALWPVAAARMNLDALTECFGSVLAYLSSDVTRVNELPSVCILIVRSFRQSIGNSSNKKKTVSSFTQYNFVRWVRFICVEVIPETPTQRDEKSLKSEVYQAGIDVLFSVDSLKGSQDPLATLLSNFFTPGKSGVSQVRIVPILYRAYIQEMRKHRLAIFGSCSNQSQDHTVQNKVRDAGMRAFTKSYRMLREYGHELEVWQSVLSLLEVLEEANFVGFGLSEKTDVLNGIASWAVDVLAKSTDSSPKTLEYALQVLIVLSRIDFEVINPLMQDILSGLLIVNPAVFPAVQVLLHELLNFHSKTRTIPSYLSVLIDCLSSSPLSGSVASVYAAPLALHRACASGSLLSLAHLEDLSRAVKGFLTPGQTPETVKAALEALFTVWAIYSGIGNGDDDAVNVNENDGVVSMKVKISDSRKQKSGKPGESSASTSVKERSAVSYSLVARVIAIVLPSIPFSTLPESSYATVRLSVSEAWGQFIEKAALTAFNTPSSVARIERWSDQVATAASLRIRHALVMCPSLCSLPILESRVVPCDWTAAIVRSVEATPELVVELIRSFFDRDLRHASSEDHEAVVEAMLAYLTSNLCNFGGERRERDETRATWNASSSSLELSEPGGHQRGALAVWHLVLDRWLPIIDEIASVKDMKVLAEMCVLPDNQTSSTLSEGLTFDWVLERAIRSAAFWELPNLRDALITVIDEASEHAHWTDFAKLMKQVRFNSKKPTILWSPHQVQSVAATFEVLLRAPREYLPRASLLEYVRRAMASDLAVFLCTQQATVDLATVHRTRTVIRAWLSSMSDMFSVVDVVADSDDYIEYLALSADVLGSVNEAYKVATLELLANAHRQIIRSASHGDNEQLKGLCLSLQNLVSADRRDDSSGLAEESLFQFIEILISEFPSNEKLSSTFLKAVEGLFSIIDTKYSTAITALLSDPGQKVYGGHESTIRAYGTSLVLRRWLSADRSANCIGVKLLQNLIFTECDQKHVNPGLVALSTQIFILLLEELHFVAFDERETHLALIVSSYVLLVSRLELADKETCDLALGGKTRTLSLKDFTFALSIIRDAIARGLSTNRELQSMVHLSCVMVGDAPEGASKATQEHFEECLQIFSANAQFVSGDADLSLEVLNFIGGVCSEKPASIRLLTIGPIWVFLAKLLTGSRMHTAHSHASLLHAITGVAGALVRLRRDLAAATLPHLSDVLRLLLRGLRTPRPALGARQHALVSDTLPWWVAPAAPLGPDEARAVARVLTGLQAKTIPRTFASRGRDRNNGGFAAEGPRAEALVGAFSKHAGPVLGAYVGAIGDALVVLAPAVRIALAPGLYTLCDAMGEHGRDALMAGGLDAGGRAALKALWKEYEKQRYVGEG